MVWDHRPNPPDLERTFKQSFAINNIFMTLLSSEQPSSMPRPFIGAYFDNSHMLNVETYTIYTHKPYTSYILYTWTPVFWIKMSNHITYCSCSYKITSEVRSGISKAIWITFFPHTIWVIFIILIRSTSFAINLSRNGILVIIWPSFFMFIRNVWQSFKRCLLSAGWVSGNMWTLWV